MKCWKSAFNAQGSRLIIVALQIAAVKIYAATVEALVAYLKKKERLRSAHPWILSFFNFFESHPIYDQTQGFSVVFLTL